MFKTFIAEIKHIFSSKWKIAGFFLMLFIPFIYGFMYMSAYWSPFTHVDKLNIGVTTMDKDANDKESNESKDLRDKLSSKTTEIANQIYQFKKVESTNSEELVNSGEYAAILEIPKGYSLLLNDFAKNLTNAILLGLKNADGTYFQVLDPNGSGTMIDANFKIEDIKKDFAKYVHILENGLINGAHLYPTLDTSKIPSVSQIIEGINKKTGGIKFYNSFKNNYLEGEITNFLFGSSDLLSKIVFSPIWLHFKPLFDNINTLIPNSILYSKIQNAIESNILDQGLNNLIKIENTTSGTINTYGFGLSPYFISIALWAGALVMTFFIKNERHINNIGTFQHYFGKWLVWISAATIQMLILVTAITIQGVNLGTNQWRVYLWTWFVAITFATIVQAIAFSIRYGDIGEFFVVILLVLQLVSSSGTFPVEMQYTIFKILHPIAPFTYAINGIREIYWNPNVENIFINWTILLAFPCIFIPMSLTINYLFDKKNVKLIKGSKIYESFEIHVDDH